MLVESNPLEYNVAWKDSKTIPPILHALPQQSAGTPECSSCSSGMQLKATIFSSRPSTKQDFPTKQVVLLG